MVLEERMGRMKLTAELVESAIRVANRYPKNRGSDYFSIRGFTRFFATKEQRKKYG